MLYLRLKKKQQNPPPINLYSKQLQTTYWVVIKRKLMLECDLNKYDMDILKH